MNTVTIEQVVHAVKSGHTTRAALRDHLHTSKYHIKDMVDRAVRTGKLRFTDPQGLSVAAV